MTYPTLETVNATTDVSEILVYVNTLTNGYAMPAMLFGFFMVIFLSSIFAQLRFRGLIRFDFSFAAAGFATLGMAVIMSTRDGLLNPIYLLLSIGVAILGAIWLYMSSE